METATQTFFEDMQVSDWLQRNSTNYTVQRKSNRLGWEEQIQKGSAYSTFLFNPGGNISPTMKLMYTKQSCHNVIGSMNVDRKNIKLYFGQKDSFTDTQTMIQVSIEPLGDSSGLPTFNHCLDVVLGETVHEMAHVLYTGMDFSDYLQAIKNKHEQAVKKNICNVIEDERIEMMVGDAYAGYANYLSSMKHWVYYFKVKEALAQLEQKEAHEPVEELFMCFLYMIRYPQSLEEELVNKYETELRQIQKILTPYPATFEEVKTATDEVYKIFAQHQQEQEEEQEDGDGEGEGSESEGEGGGQGQGKGKGKSTDPSGNGSGDNQSDKDFDDLSDEEKEALAKALFDALGQMLEEVEQNDTTQGPGKKLPASFKISEGDGKAQRGDDTSSMKTDLPSRIKAVDHLTEPQLEALADNSQRLITGKQMQATGIMTEFKDLSKSPRPAQYQQSLSLVQHYAVSLRAKLKKFNRNRLDSFRGLHEGTFDEDRLVDAKLGAKDVFYQNARIFNNGASIALLIDESGSMMGTEIIRARDIAVMFERALYQVNNIDFYCYGHTTNTKLSEESTYITGYFEGRKTGKPECLGNINAHNTNRDGHALIQVAGRIRKHTKQPVVLFMISDGMPSASTPYGFDGVSYVRHAVKLLKRENIHVIHIGIDNSVKSELMFEKYVKFTNMDTLVSDIGGILGEVVSKIQKPSVTFE